MKRNGDIDRSNRYAKEIERLLLFSKLISKHGLTYSFFGNISIKSGKNIIIKNRGVNLDLALGSDFSSISLDDSIDQIQNNTSISSEWRMHYLSYLKNPSLEAILHLHPVYISILDDLGMDLVSDDLEFNYLLKGKIKKVPFYEPGSKELAGIVASSLNKFPFLILNKHGIVSVAEDIERAYNCALTAEILAKKLVYLRLLKNLC